MSENCCDHCNHIDVIEVKLENIEKKLDNLVEYLEKNFVRKEEFTPVKRLVYGALTLLLGGGGGGALTMYLKDIFK